MLVTYQYQISYLLFALSHCARKPIGKTPTSFSLQGMVPISLMITVTVVKFAQGKIMSQDSVLGLWGCGLRVEILG